LSFAPPRKAMVLAAGLGTRLRPITDTVPKPLVDIDGRPMIEYPLRMLAAAGVREVVVNLHHLGDAIRAALGDGARYGIRIHYSPEDPILDTGGAIVGARRWLEDEPFFLANSDAMLDPDLAMLWSRHAERGAIATLVVREDAAAERYGALDVDASGRIRRMLGRPREPTTVEPLARHMFCGVHAISPEIFAHLPGRRVFSITRDVYVPLVEAGAALYAMPYTGYWRDLGTIDSVSKAREDRVSGRFTPAYLTAY
jgi:mannose-1-phosphate guanylyltransferase